MESPSRILEALDDLPIHTEDIDPVVFRAARFPTLLYQDCEKCDNGRVLAEGHGWTPSPGTHPTISCPSCGGLGVVPTEDAIEVGAVRAHALYNESAKHWSDEPDKTFWRGVARAVLAALRTIGDEG